MSTLLRGFDLPRETLASQDAKELMASVKVEYLRRAKQQHPDLVPDERKALAEDQFKVLHEEFSEATKLLEDGVVVRHLPSAMNGHSGEMSGGPGVTMRYPMHAHPSTMDFQAGPRYPVHKQPQFDTITNLRCHAIFWSGLMLFLMGLREFLVWSAGSTYAWSRPANLNPFWIRRFQDDWTGRAKEDRKPKVDKNSAEAIRKAKYQKKMSELEAKRDRGLDEFYQKRHISNRKQKYSVRGQGGVSL